MNILPLALRNVLRNRRRTALTLGALGVSAAAMVLLGGYVSATVKGLQTTTVRQTGHLQVMVRGYLDFGRSNPARFAIQEPDRLAALLRADPVLGPLAHVVTPVLQVQGVAGRFASGQSSNFAGTGWQPLDRLAMLAWDGQGMRMPPAASHLSAERPLDGVVGVGLAQLLGLCEALQARHCASAPAQGTDPAQAEAVAIGDDLAQLSRQARAAADGPAGNAEGGGGADTAIELLAASPGGAPNVVRMNVARAEPQGVRERDGMYVGLPLPLAQRLVFGPGAAGASAIVVQLHRTEDMAAARQRIEALLRGGPDGGGGPRQDLEVRDFQDVAPAYNQVVAMFGTLFGFVSVLMAAVTVFSVANTVNMAVSERTGEIGSLRAMGLKARHIRRLFIAEGSLIGLAGAVLGVAAALLAAHYGINQAGWQWTPPGNSAGVPVGIDVAGSAALCLGVVATLTKIAGLSSWWPAFRASRMEIVEALRHA